MSGDIFHSTAIPVLEQVVNFAQSRHNVLAGNIANLDTPGYRVRDLSPAKFEARLREALSARERHQPLSAAAAQFSTTDPLTEVGQDLEGILLHDDSNGSLEGQVSAMAKNQMQHNLALAIMGNQFRLLQAAISERV